MIRGIRPFYRPRPAKDAPVLPRPEPIALPDPFKTPRATVHTAATLNRGVRRGPVSRIEERDMSKGMDQKKSEKKKPEKTMKEKRAAKKEKKGK